MHFINGRTDMDALIKIIRLIANLFTLEQIGVDYITKHRKGYKAILNKLNDLIAKKDAKNHSVLIRSFVNPLITAIFERN